MYREKKEKKFKLFSSMTSSAYLLFRASLFDEEMDDAKVLQSLPVTYVLEFGILYTEIQHGRMSLQNLTHNLWSVECGMGIWVCVKTVY